MVTNQVFTTFRTFHKECYQKALKRGKLPGRPANTAAANISLGIILAIALVFYYVTRKILLLAVLLGSLIYRLIVWLRFERHLK